MINFLKLYAASFLAFLVIDLVWLGVIARGFYQKHLGYILAPDPNWIAAFIFYALFVAGIVVFVVIPGLEARSLAWTMGRGALFGLVAYATYDLTNLATVRDWPVIVTVVDLAWGTFLSVAVACAGYAAGT